MVYCDHIPAVGDQLQIGRPRAASDQVFNQSLYLGHVSGPNCVSNAGYKSRNISLAGIHGCRTMQWLVQKDFVYDWQPEGDDLGLELDRHYFLSRIADDAMPFHPYELSRSRFGSIDVNRLMSWLYSGVYNQFRLNLDEAVQ